MTITVDTAELRAALAAVKPAVAKRYHLPALGCVRLDQVNDHLVVSATDLETFATYRIRSTGELAGPVIVDYKQFTASIPKGKGSTSISDDGRFDYGASSATLSTLSADEWPKQSHASENPVTASAAPFAAVLPAASTDQVRPILTAIHVDGHSVVATDSYRLHLEERDSSEAELPSMLIPSKLIQMALKGKADSLLFTTEDRAGRTFVSVTAGDLTVSAQVIEGQFPNYRQLIPNPADQPNRLDLTGASATILQVGKADSAGCVTFVLNSSVTATNSDGSVSATLPKGDSTYPDMKVRYNAHYLADVLATAGDMLQFADALKPAVMRSAGGLRLIMPVRCS